LRGKISIGLALYGWIMLLVDFGLHRAALPDGPDRGLGQFRQQIMGRGALLLGALTVLAALILGAVSWRKSPRLCAIAVFLSVAWGATAFLLRDSL
jgi:hypothetical protein